MQNFWEKEVSDVFINICMKINELQQNAFTITR